MIFFSYSAQSHCSPNGNQKKFAKNIDQIIEIIHYSVILNQKLLPGSNINNSEFIHITHKLRPSMLFKLPVTYRIHYVEKI